MNTSGLAYSVASWVPAPLARFGVASPLTNMLGQAAKSAGRSASTGEARSATSAAGNAPPAEETTAATNDQPAAAAATTDETSGSKPGEPSTAPTAPTSKAKTPPSDPIPDLLRKGWKLRDQLLETDVYGGYVMVAPTKVRRYEATLMELEQTYRVGSFEDHSLIRELRQLIEPLELITRPDLAATWTRRQRELVDAWRGPALPIGVPHSLGFARTLGQSRPEAAFQAAAELSAALEKLVAKDATRAQFDAWIAGLSAEDQTYTEVRLATRLAAVAGLSWPRIQLALQSALLGETVASSQPRFSAWIAR